MRTLLSVLLLSLLTPTMLIGFVITLGSALRSCRHIVGAVYVAVPVLDTCTAFLRSLIALSVRNRFRLCHADAFSLHTIALCRVRAIQSACLVHSEGSIELYFFGSWWALAVQSFAVTFIRRLRHGGRSLRCVRWDRLVKEQCQRSIHLYLLTTK